MLCTLPPFTLCLLPLLMLLFPPPCRLDAGGVPSNSMDSNDGMLLKADMRLSLVDLALWDLVVVRLLSPEEDPGVSGCGDFGEVSNMPPTLERNDVPRLKRPADGDRVSFPCQNTPRDRRAPRMCERAPRTTQDDGLRSAQAAAHQEKNELRSRSSDHRNFFERCGIAGVDRALAEACNTTCVSILGKRSIPLIATARWIDCIVYINSCR